MTVTTNRTCPSMLPLVANLPPQPDYGWIHVTWTISLPSAVEVERGLA